MRKNTNYLIAAGLIALILFLYFAKRALTPFFLAFAIAYLLDPLVDRLEKFNIPRTAGVILLMVVFSGLLFVSAVILLPMFQLQVHDLTVKLPDYVSALQNLLHPLFEEISGFESAKMKEITTESFKKFGELPLHILSNATTFIWSSISNLFTLVLMAFNLFVIPVVTFYLLRDFDIIKDKLFNLIPLRFKDKTLEILREVDAVLASFVRGQLMIACLMAVLYSIGLYLCGTPLGLFIGMIAGLANMVPYLGLIFGLLPATILTLLHYQQFAPILWVVLVFGVVHALESIFITPRVMGNQIGLHPVIIMLSILIGAEFFGLSGILLAVPFTAVLNVLARRGLIEYKKSSLYS